MKSKISVFFIMMTFSLIRLTSVEARELQAASSLDKLMEIYSSHIVQSTNFDTDTSQPATIVSCLMVGEEEFEEAYFKVLRSTPLDSGRMGSLEKFATFLTEKNRDRISLSFRYDGIVEKVRADIDTLRSRSSWPEKIASIGINIDGDTQGKILDFDSKCFSKDFLEREAPQFKRLDRAATPVPADELSMYALWKQDAQTHGIYIDWLKGNTPADRTLVAAAPGERVVSTVRAMSTAMIRDRVNSSTSPKSDIISSPAMILRMQNEGYRAFTNPSAQIEMRVGTDTQMGTLFNGNR